jgi:hypothetical protein
MTDLVWHGLASVPLGLAKLIMGVCEELQSMARAIRKQTMFGVFIFHAEDMNGTNFRMTLVSPCKVLSTFLVL